jgi:hypothetical protein
MTAAFRLILFAGLLAALFGTAAFAGSRLDVEPATKADGGDRADGGEMAPMGGEAGGEHAERGAAPQPVRGLAVSDKGYTLQLARETAPRGKRFELAFRIVDRRGETVRDFDVEHTKRMHLIVVRRDTTNFQHLHPKQRRDGSWSVPARLRDAGSYRVYADFSAGGNPHTLAADVTVDGPVRSQELPSPANTVDVDGLRVTLGAGAGKAGAESQLRFSVSRNGRAVAVEDYLGAKGHLVALREGDLAFLHVHPDEERLNFMAEFPSAGRYRLFVQFKTDGRVHTAAFTQEVSR